MSEPSKIPLAWAALGDYDAIPESQISTGRSSWELGFPPETQIPLSAGGVAPYRQDINGVLNWMSKSLIWYQQGGLWQYDATVDYEVGNHILENGSLYYCIQANGPNSTVKSPSADTAEAYWKPIIFANGRHPDPDHLLAPAVTQVLQAVYPVGSIYCSYGSTSPATLFGFGQWTKIEGRFLLGANSTYSLGSTGGSATVVLTVAQLPAHSHGASSASAGAHTHTLSGSAASGGAHTHNASSASAGAHTHTITVNSGGAHTHTASSASNGAHTHTRGTMEITGSISSADTDEYLIYADVLTADGAFRLGPQVDGRFVGGDYEGKVRQSFNFAASRSWTGATSSNGAHTHAITVNSGGAHTHGASSASAGAHTHTITVNSGGSHTHNISGTAANSGAHTHTITVSNTGSGQAHSNMPPYLAVNMWRRTA